MATGAPTRIFISYARKDASELAQRLRDELLREGFKPWMDTGGLTGGSSWTPDIEQAIDAAEVVLAVVTHGSYVSEICRAETFERCVWASGLSRFWRKRARIAPCILKPSTTATSPAISALRSGCCSKTSAAAAAEWCCRSNSATPT